VHATNTPTGKINKIEPGRVNAARLGFKGSEDLGGGLSAIFDIESAIGPDTGSAGAPFWGRGSYVAATGTSTTTCSATSSSSGALRSSTTPASASPATWSTTR
jgi:hypothetical protein